MLSFVLSKLPALKKRAYVARYLLPVDVPPEFLANEALAETLSQYRALQAEFKDTHKAYEKGMAAMTGPGACARLLCRQCCACSLTLAGWP